MSILSTPAILLRSYPYSETSLTLRFYSESNGVLAAIARGVRKAGGRRGGALASFSEGVLDVQYKENRDLFNYAINNYHADILINKSRRGVC